MCFNITQSYLLIFRTTKSLPIMRKPHQRDQVDNCSINDLLKCLKQLEHDTSTSITDRNTHNDDTYSSKPTTINDKNPGYNDQAIWQSLKLPTISGVPYQEQNTFCGSINPDIASDKRNTKSPFDVTGENFANVDKQVREDVLENLPQPSKESKDMENEKIVNTVKRDNMSSPSAKLEFQNHTPGFSRTPPREPLKRQNPIQSKNSSQESSNESDKKSRGSKDKNSESLDLKEGTSELIQGDNNVFRSISIQRSPCKDTLYTSLVHIVIPKPKVDKSTQVSHTEITTETGWNVMEGLYLLMRRMSIEVPTLPGEAGDDIAVQSNNQGGIPAGVASDKGLEVSNAVRNAREENDNMNNSAYSGNMVLPSLHVEAVQQNDTLEARNRNNVDDWLERNREIMNIQANLLEPARQLTVETVDSGYDDNPSNYNRSPRWSLPLIRQGNVNANGHPRLFRRPYKGQMVLPAKLVLSTSSQSQGNSFEKREKDDDADDENDNSVDEYNFDAEKLNLIRKRRHFSRRVESFSLSDSELETKKSSYKRNRRGWKDVLLVNRLFPKKERVKAVNAWASEKPWDTARRRLNSIGKLPTVTGIKQLSVDSTDDDVTVFTDSTEPANPNSKHQRMNLRNPHPPSSWKDISSGSEKQLNSVSSLDDSYRGFGISKPSRNDFLSHIDGFQNLYPTGLDVNLLERSAVDDDDSKLEIKSVSKMSMSSRSTESEGVEDEILRSYIRHKRHSWDGILDSFNVADYHFNLENESEVEGDGESIECEQTEGDKLDAISDVENIFGDDGSYIGEFMNDSSNVDLYECFDDYLQDDGDAKTHVDPPKPEENNSFEVKDSDNETPSKSEINSNEAIQQLKEDESDAQIFFEDIDKKIRVAGSGLSNGQVGVKNSFQVGVSSN